MDWPASGQDTTKMEVCNNVQACAGSKRRVRLFDKAQLEKQITLGKDEKADPKSSNLPQ